MYIFLENKNTSKYKKASSKLLLLLLFTLLFGCDSSFKESPKLIDGRITISLQHLKKSPSLLLRGEGIFYWQQWPINDEGVFDNSLLTKSDTISWPPSIWTSINYPAKGYGTFRFSLDQSQLEEAVVLNFDRVVGAVEVWINGEKVEHYGNLSKDGSTEVLDGRPLRIELPQEDTLDILFLVSSHSNRLGGGFSLQNQLQTKSSFEKSYPSKSFIEGFITLLIVLFGFYQLYRYIAFKTYIYFLFFGLFCLIGASRQFFVGENSIYYFFPDMSFTIVQKMRYVGYFGGLATIILYHYALFPKYVSRLFAKVTVIIPILGVIYVIVAPIYYGTLIAPFFQVYGLLAVFLGFYLTIRGMIDKKPYATWVLISLLMTSGAFINDILNAMQILQTDYIVNYGVLFYVIFQVYLNHKIQKDKEKRLVTLASNVKQLESDVDAKIEEIEKLRVETFQQLKSKERLVDDLRKVKSEEVSISSIIANLKSELLEDAQLTMLKNDIESLNYEFISRIQKRHPNLTKTDLEICTYLKMSLSRKEIAQLRFTSTEAVKKSRSRLRKKMELSGDIDLETYLKSI